MRKMSPIVDNQCSHKWSQIKFKRIGLNIMEMTLPSNKMTSQWENTALSEPFQILIGKIVEIKRKTKHMTLTHKYMTTRFLYFIYTITIRVEGLINKGWKYRRGIKMDNAEGEDKKSKIHNTICVGQHCTHTNTNNVNRTLALIQPTGRKDEANIVVNITTRKSERKDTVL